MSKTSATPSTPVGKRPLTLVGNTSMLGLKLGLMNRGEEVVAELDESKDQSLTYLYPRVA